MKIAVALFGKRVSPNFSTAPELLILIAQEGKTPCSWRAQMEGMSSRQRVLRLASMGVDILVCGGIDRSTRTELERRGIRVVSDVQGDPMDFLRGLMSPGGVLPMGARRKRDPDRPDGGEGRPSSPGRKSSREKAPVVMVLMAYRPVGSLLETSLKDEGMEALQCCSAGEALRSLSQGEASVVITDPADLFWQDPQALELLERLTQTPLVAFSALSAQELDELPLRFAAIVAKSSNLEPLLETVRSLRGG